MKFKKWNIGTPAETDVNLLRNAGYPYLLSTVLAARGISTAEDAASFQPECSQKSLNSCCSSVGSGSKSEMEA